MMRTGISLLIQNPGESHIEIRPDASVSNGSCNWDVTLYDANEEN